MRHPYHDKSRRFDIKDLVAKEPFGQFEHWFKEACEIKQIAEPNAMALATASVDGFPSVRMVLMKSFDKDGFVFYTNHESRKGMELKENPHCSLMFYWEPLKRSVRIEGTVCCLSSEESEKYFHSRPRESQIGAIVSKQSTVIPSREFLDTLNNQLHEKYADPNSVIPKPEYWGGYRVIPSTFEFWQGQSNRLHDRLRFCKSCNMQNKDMSFAHEMEDGWLLERLSP